MFKTCQAALEMVTQRKRSLIPRLNHFVKAMEALGNPQSKLRVIHVAGTNGKGSTTDYIRSILQTQGYRVGTFTSPHLVCHHDRFRINDVMISDADLLKYMNQTYPMWDQYQLTMFEIDVLISVLYFLDQKVDYVVYEVGLGGRYDATNIVTPIASVITNVSYDHMEILGNSLLEIASEKAGIIKGYGLVVTGEKNQAILEVFREKAQRNIFQVLPFEIVRSQQFIYRGQKVTIQSLASYQMQNAACAFEVCYQLNQHHIIEISLDNIIQGLYATQWAGRFEIMSQQPFVLIDGAHNQSGVQALVHSIGQFQKPLVVVFAALADKQTDQMLELLINHSDHLIVTEFDFYRAQKAHQLANGFQVVIEPNWQQAITKGLTLSQSGTLLITGSLYFISEVRNYWRKEYNV